MAKNKYVYFFGNKKAEGDAKKKELLGGKGANLAEMTNLGVPVPAGFTISTEVCDLYYKNNKKYPAGLSKEVDENIKKIENSMGKQFGDVKNPLLVSVRSGAAQSMPGMMDTILNLGINEKVAASLSKSIGERFAWDSYRRFIQMFSSVAMGVEMKLFDNALEKLKKQKKVELDTELTAADLKKLVEEYKAIYKKEQKTAFPEDPKKQLWAAINAVFGSWNNERAIQYRKIHDIRGLLGTAVNVQSMVFGNLGVTSATGVCFTRNPSTGENKFYGEYLINAQGEDVVAGIRTPQKMSVWESKNWAKNNGVDEKNRKAKFPSLEESNPQCYKELYELRSKLEKHYKDMQDMEFTIEDGRLYMLQTRNGKRTGAAALKIAVDMIKEKLISEKEAIRRIDPGHIDMLLHPAFKPGQKKVVIAKGLNASPGAAVGKAVFSAEDAVKEYEAGHHVILVRTETSPEDIEGMHRAKGILTARGGSTSHAAVVARQMGVCCVAGCGTLEINEKTKKFRTKDGIVVKQGDMLSLDGTSGEVIKGGLLTEDPKLSGDFAKIMKLSDKYASMKVRTNADTPADAKRALDFGAKGIGLCRTEHMFFAEERISKVREMILSSTEEERRKALDKILPMQQGDFEKIFNVMKGKPVIIRLLDPPLHEFLPHGVKEQSALAKELNITPKLIKQKISELSETNPMLGFRGCRLSILYPEILEMQVKAIVKAAIKLKKKKISVKPEIMIPLAGEAKELSILSQKAKSLVKDELKKAGINMKIMIGTMIEVPRAAVTSDEIASEAEFFSFGTNDLTQMTCGFSRDDAASFLGAYVEQGIYDYDPFQVLDQTGVGRLMELAIKQAQKVNQKLEIGICGEHGGEPQTVVFCHKLGLDYVSCSPLRVPIARLMAAKANL